MKKKISLNKCGKSIMCFYYYEERFYGTISTHISEKLCNQRSIY